MKKTLYNINQEALQLYNELEENGGELTPEIEAQLTINNNELVSKSIAYLEVIEDRKSFINRLDDEIKRLQNMKKANTNLVDRLENSLLMAQQTYGDYEVGFKKITTRKSESIEDLDVNSLPKEYKVIKIVETADKVKLKEAIKSGVKIEGVELKVNNNLRIK